MMLRLRKKLCLGVIGNLKTTLSRLTAAAAEIFTK
jgi:hypothetical protein